MTKLEITPGWLHVYLATAAPTTGLYQRGDIVINYPFPVAGGPIAWVCTVGDGTTTGTWKALQLTPTTWVTATVYPKDTLVVSSSGDVFICIADHTSASATEPGIGASTASVWLAITYGLTADQNAALNAATTLSAAHPPYIPGEVLPATTITGDTSGPALAVSGGAVATYGAELLTNPDFTTNADGWTLNSGAEWNAAGEIWFYPGVIATTSLNAGGTDYEVGDVLDLQLLTNIAPTNMTSNSLPAPYSVSTNFTTAPTSAYKLFDATVDDLVGTGKVPSVGSPINIMIDLGAETLAEGLGIQESYYGTANQFPADFVFSGSNYSDANHANPPARDTDADWTTLTSQTGQTSGAGVRDTNQYTFAGGTYRYYRLQITATVGVSDACILNNLYIYQWAGGGAQVTVATLSGSAVATYTLSNAGKLYLVGTATASGGHGTGCAINILTLTTGSITQTVTTEAGGVYRCVPTFSDGQSGVFLAATPDYGTEAIIGSIITGADFMYSKGWTGTVTVTSGAVLFYKYSQDTHIGKISAISYKKVTGYPGNQIEFYGSGGIIIGGMANIRGDLDCLLFGKGNAPLLTDGYGNVAIGVDNLTSLIGGGGNVAVGIQCLTGVESSSCSTGVGYQAGKDYAEYQGTFMGNGAGAGAVGSYLTCVGAAAGWNATSGDPATANMSLYMGFYCGHTVTGVNNVFLCGGQSSGASRTVSNTVLITTDATNDFLLGFHDVSSTTGYLNLRGDFNPSTTATYDLGSSAAKWQTLYASGINTTEVIVAVTGGLSALQCSGTTITNYGQAADVVYSLPAAATGLSFKFVAGTTVAKYLRFDPNASEVIYLDGAALTGGYYVGIASIAAGESIEFTTFKTGASAWAWHAHSVSGTWVAETA